MPNSDIPVNDLTILQGPVQINARSAPPREDDFHDATVITDSTIQTLAGEQT